jgi:hypothetical protein
VSESNDLMLATGLEHAFVGLVNRFNVLDPIACYDYDRVIQGYIEEGMTEEEAVEYFEFNVIGAWAGERTPCFVRHMSLAEAIEMEGGDA